MMRATGSWRQRQEQAGLFTWALSKKVGILFKWLFFLQLEREFKLKWTNQVLNHEQNGEVFVYVEL